MYFFLSLPQCGALDLIIVSVSDEERKSWRSSLCSFSYPLVTFCVVRVCVRDFYSFSPTGVFLDPDKLTKLCQCIVNGAATDVTKAIN